MHTVSCVSVLVGGRIYEGVPCPNFLSDAREGGPAPAPTKQGAWELRRSFSGLLGTGFIPMARDEGRDQSSLPEYVVCRRNVQAVLSFILLLTVQLVCSIDFWSVPWNAFEAMALPLSHPLWGTLTHFCRRYTGSSLTPCV